MTNGIGAVLDGMLKRGSGHIVNMISDAGRKVYYKEEIAFMNEQSCLVFAKSLVHYDLEILCP